MLWSLDAKSWLIGKDLDAGKDWGQKEKGAVDDRMVSISNSMDMDLHKFQETVKDRGEWNAVVHGVTESDMT